MEDKPDSAFFRYAKRAYVLIDRQGIVRYKHVMNQPGHHLESAEILGEVEKVVKGK